MSEPLEASVAKPAVILFGDSLTAWSFNTFHGQGFGENLEQHYAPSGIEVENEGYPGYTTETVKPMFAAVMKRIRTQHTVPPLLITVFLGANDAVLWPTVHVPIQQFIDNIRYFVDEILSEPKAKGAKVLLITTPPINAVEAIWPETLAGTPEDLSQSEFEEECRASIGHRTWESKLRYAQAVMDLARSYQERGESRVRVVDFWAAATNYALGMEQRDVIASCKDVILPLDVDARLPGCGVPGAKEFPDGVMTDRLHLGDRGYRVLTDAVMRVLQSIWPEVLKPISLE